MKSGGVTVDSIAIPTGKYHLAGRSAGGGAAFTRRLARLPPLPRTSAVPGICLHLAPFLRVLDDGLATAFPSRCLVPRTLGLQRKPVHLLLFNHF